MGLYVGGSEALLITKELATLRLHKTHFSTQSYGIKDLPTIFNCVV